MSQFQLSSRNLLPKNAKQKEKRAQRRESKPCDTCVFKHLFRHEKEKLHTLLRMISGARYSGVPHSVQVLPFTRLANPKSVTYKSGAHTAWAKCGFIRATLCIYFFVVAHLNVAVVVNEKVFWLQISVYEI